MVAENSLRVGGKHTLICLLVPTEADTSLKIRNRPLVTPEVKSSSSAAAVFILTHLQCICYTYNF